MASDLQFDAETHTYRYEGNVVAGVTSVLEAVGLSDFSMVPPDTLEQAKAFGTEVHKAAEKLDLGEQVPSNVSGMCSIYLCHYVQFLNDFKVKMVDIEKKVFCKKYMYAGTLDRIAIFEKLSQNPVLFDIKTGGKSKAHRIQTAAYEYAYKNDKRKTLDRYTLYLYDEGYKLSEPYTSRTHFDVFLHALSLNNFIKGEKN